MNAKAPTHAPSTRPSPPITAMMSRSIVAPTRDAEIWPFHQTKSTPASDATNAAKPNATFGGEEPRSRARPAGRARRVRPGARDRTAFARGSGSRRRRTKRDQARCSTACPGARRRLRPRRACRCRDRREAAQLGHLAEEVVRNHAERQREHQEVDAEASRPNRAHDQSDHRREAIASTRASVGSQPRVSPFDSPCRDQVPEHVSGDSHQRVWASEIIPP